MKNGFKEFYKLILPVCAYGVTSGREYCPELNPENSKDRNETKLRRKKEKNKEHIKRYTLHRLDNPSLYYTE